VRTYGKIETGFWQNHKVRALDRQSRELLLYLFTCPHGNSVGCFGLPLGYVMDDLALPEDKVQLHLRHLAKQGFIERNETTGLTRIIGWWGHNGIENPNVAGAVCKQLAGLPPDPIADRAIQDLRSHLQVDDFAPKVAQVLREKCPMPKRVPKPSVGVNGSAGELFATNSEPVAKSSASRARGALTEPEPNPNRARAEPEPSPAPEARENGAPEPSLVNSSRLGRVAQPPNRIQELTGPALARYGPTRGVELLDAYAQEDPEAIAELDALVPIAAKESEP
jgi:hypothetical protein